MWFRTISRHFEAFRGCKASECRFARASGTKYEGPGACKASLLASVCVLRPFVSSQIQGRGTFVWPDGSKYEGELSGGRRNGSGCYESHDGGPFECLSGLFWAGKTRYEGWWLDGKRHGSETKGSKG